MSEKDSTLPQSGRATRIEDGNRSEGLIENSAQWKLPLSDSEKEQQYRQFVDLYMQRA